MGAIYYHNITKGWYNEEDMGDAVESSKKGDVIKFSVRGCSVVYDLKTLEGDDFDEYGWIRRHLCDYFKEFWEEDFYEK